MAPQPMLLSARSARPGSTDVLLLLGDSPAQGYRLMQPDLGNVDWAKFYSGARGTQGARLAGAEAQNRAVSLQLECVGASQDDLWQKLDLLYDLDNEWRRFGGSLTWRPKNGSFKVNFDVLDSSFRLGPYDRNLHLLNRVRCELLPVCAPYLRGDPYDIFDGFDVDSSGDWTKDTDGAGFSISGGVLQPSASGTSRLRHTGRGYRYSDQEIQVKIRTGSTVTSLDVAVFICGDINGSETFLGARIQGGNLRITKYIAGTPVDAATGAFTPSANSTYWLRFRREQRRLFADVYADREPQVLGSTPSQSISYQLTIDEAATYQAGHSGLRIASVSTGESYDDFIVQPFTYKDNVGLPDERILTGSIPGDAPALADFSIAQNGASAIPVWGLLGWSPKPMPWNWCSNGDFEDDVDGWSVAAVSGVTGAATSITRGTTTGSWRYGGAYGSLVMPATANTGGTFKIQRRFLPGRFYTLLVWAKSAAQVTAARCRLGVSGDIASSPASALSTSDQLYSCVWSPSTNQNGAYACFEITAATLTTALIDGICVVEGGFPVFTGVNSTQTLLRMYASAEEYPPTPFLAIIDAGTGQQEIVQVDNVGPEYLDTVSGTTLRDLTIVRGREGTTGQVHVTNDILTPLPTNRPQLEGKGGQPCFGFVEAESADLGNLFTWTIQGTSGTRLGNDIRVTSGGGSGKVFADYLLDPSLTLPDDFTQGEIAIEVWARLAINASLTAPVTVVAGVMPETGIVVSGTPSSTFGAIRYTEEFGAAGRPLVKPSSGEVWRFVRLGTVRFPVDRSRPLRWRLFVTANWPGATIGATFAMDYLALCPAQARALSPTAKANDANFPKFFATTSTALKTIRSDLSGLIGRPFTTGAGTAPGAVDHGLGGSLIELPSGQATILGKLSSVVPDDPTSNTSTEELSYSGYMHVAVTPRFSLGRGS